MSREHLRVTPRGSPQTPIAGNKAADAEKRELKSLNKRLEYYLLQQREKAAIISAKQKEIEAEKTRHANLFETLKIQYEDEIKQLRLDRQKAEKDVATLAVELDNTKHDALEIQKETALLQNKHKFYLSNQALKDSRVANQKKVEELKSNLSEMQHLQNETQASAVQISHRKEAAERDIQKAYERIAEVNNESKKQQETNALLEDELENVKQQTINALNRDKVQDLAHLQHAYESESSRTAAVHAAKITEIQANMAIKAENDRKELRELYEVKLSEYRRDLEETGHQLARAKEDARAYQDARGINNTLSNEAAQLNGEVRVLNREIEELISEKDAILKEIKADQKQRENEFTDAFDPELVAEALYDMSDLLDGKPAKKKQKLAPIEEEVVFSEGPEEAEAEQTPEVQKQAVVSEEEVVVEAKENSVQDKGEAMEEEEDNERSTLTIGSDAYSRYVTIMNDSDDNFDSMAGWKLIFHSTSYEFQFPAVALNAQDKFQIRMGTQVPFGFGDDGQGGLVPDGSWSVQGDRASLLSPDGEVQAEFDILPEEVEEAAPEGNGCHIM